MGVFRRAPRDGVQMRQLYPEPWFITMRPAWATLYRFLLGRPMDGVRWTNSSFWHSATEGEDHWWLRLAGWHRLLIRVAVSYALLLLLPALTVLTLFDAYLLIAQVAFAHLLILGVPTLLLTEWYFVREHGVRIPVRSEQEGELLTMLTVREGRRAWREQMVEPVAAVAAEILDISHQRNAAEWVSVPRDFAEPGGHPVQIDLPRRFTASEAQRKRLVQAVRPRLGAMELRDEWLLKGRYPRLELSMPPAPPKMALFIDYVSMLRGTVEYEPFLGVVADGSLLAAQMVDASPHVALSAGSGAGKSKLIAQIIAQALYWGWFVIILDWKVESHEWAKGLSGVRYVSDVAALHDECVRIGDEVDVRRMLSPDLRMRRPRVLIVREEWNITAEQLSNYWAELRAQEMRRPPDEREFMPLRSPAITAMSKLDGAGRSFGMFDLLVAQRMSNRVFNGNTDARESFGLRLLSRYTMQTWKMLTSIKYVKKPSVLGRWVAVVNDEAQQFQAILGSDEEWREFAQEGKPNPPSPYAENPYAEIDSDGNGNHSHLAGSLGAAGLEIDTTLSEQLPSRAAGGQMETIVKLRKLVDISLTLEYLGVSHKALKHYRDEDPEFPQAHGGNPRSGYLYDLSEVEDYVRRRRAVESARIKSSEKR